MIPIEKTDTIDLLHHGSLTPVMNEMKSPNSFLMRNYFNATQTLTTETVELSTLEKGRKMAPMVRKNGESIPVQGYDETFAVVETPNIRIRREMTASELLFKRRPGNAIFANNATIRSAAGEHIRRELQVMSDLIANREEWMAAQALTGVISYSVADGEVFTVTLDRPAETILTSCPATISATSPPANNFWNGANALVDPLGDFREVKRIMHNQAGVQPKIALFGQEAAKYFHLLPSIVTGLRTEMNTTSRINVGSFDRTSDFTQDGLVYLGNFAGVECWEYSREVEDENGVMQPMIRSKWIEFLPSPSDMMALTYYGAIADLQIFQGRNFVTKRFTKAVMREDPPAIFQIVHTRPLPFIRRPRATVSMKVLAG